MSVKKGDMLICRTKFHSRMGCDFTIGNSYIVITVDDNSFTPVYVKSGISAGYTLTYKEMKYFSNKKRAERILKEFLCKER